MTRVDAVCRRRPRDSRRPMHIVIPCRVFPSVRVRCSSSKQRPRLNGRREEVSADRCAAQDRAPSISSHHETRDVAILKNLRALMIKLPRPQYRLYENRVGVRGTLLARTAPANHRKDCFVTEYEALLCLENSFADFAAKENRV